MTPLSLVDDPRVPIIGQPLKLHGYTLQASVQCQCSPSGPVLQVMMRLEGGRLESYVSACPQCHNRYVIYSVGATDNVLQLAFKAEPPSGT